MIHSVFTGITSMCLEDSGSSTLVYVIIHHWLLTDQSSTEYIYFVLFDSLHYADVPPSFTDSGTQPSTNSSIQPASVTQLASNPSSGSPLDFGLVGGVAGCGVLLVIVVVVCIVALVIWWR